MIIDDLGLQLRDIIQHPLPSLSVVINLILIESLLSVDNAAVLATMVTGLPKDQRGKALRYGILGAYIFRGICLYFAALLIRIWWFKPLGGLYLLFLTFSYFTKKKEPVENPVEVIDKQRSRIYKMTIGTLGEFWSTVVLVEIMDIAFSIDNVVAANAYSNNLLLVWTGVFIGILAMRFVAKGFVTMMERHPVLEVSAYTVIALLGAKLMLSLYTHSYPCAPLTVFMEGPYECSTMSADKAAAPMVWGDVLMSVLSITVFIVPLFFSWLRQKGKTKA
jgi:YkoY family integral membrane protein